MSKAQPSNPTLVALPELLLLTVDQLVPSPRNVRKTPVKDATPIEDLAASIVNQGLLQNLVVSELPSGKYAVHAGNRRLAAIKHAIKTKRLRKDFDIPCRTVSANDATSVSLTENFHRQAMHPADAFEAFAKLIAEGKSADDVAAAFAVSTLYVQQCMKLANIAPALLDQYRAGIIPLDCVKALAITDDHAAQLAAWDSLPSWDRSNAHSLKRALTQGDVRGDDPRVRYVGLEAYRAAGGQERSDLFAQGDAAVTLSDEALLDSLVLAKLTKAKAKVAKEGWGWVEAVIRLDRSALSRFGRLDGVRRPLTDAEREALDQLQAQLDGIEEEQQNLMDREDLEGEAYDAEDERLSALAEGVQAQIDAIEDSRVVHDDAAKAHAGAIVYVDHNGNRATERGLVKPADRAAVYQSVGLTPPAGRHQDDDDAPTRRTEEANDEPRAISDALARRLSAHRTVALRLAVIDHPQAALVATVHSLLMQTRDNGRFAGRRAGCLDLTVQDDARLHLHCPGIGEGKAAHALDARKAALLEGVPSERQALWDWLSVQPAERLLPLLAVGIVDGVNASQQGEASTSTVSGLELTSTARLAQLVSLDVADTWEATSDTYLDSVSKERITEAVTEACGPERAATLAKLKKGEAVKAAEAMLAGTRWLPALLRS